MLQYGVRAYVQDDGCPWDYHVFIMFFFLRFRLAFHQQQRRVLTCESVERFLFHRGWIRYFRFETDVKQSWLLAACITRNKKYIDIRNNNKNCHHIHLVSVNDLYVRTAPMNLVTIFCYITVLCDNEPKTAVNTRPLRQSNSTQSLTQSPTDGRKTVREAASYPTRYDYIDVEAVMSNERILKILMNCVMNRGPCTREGLELKSKIIYEKN